jgi:hypothetical protein
MTAEDKAAFVFAALCIIFSPLVLSLIFSFLSWKFLRRKEGRSLEKIEPKDSPKNSPPENSSYLPGDFVILNSGKRGRLKRSYGLWHDVMVDGSEEFIHEADISSLQYRER